MQLDFNPDPYLTIFVQLEEVLRQFELLHRPAAHAHEHVAAGRGLGGAEGPADEQTEQLGPRHLPAAAARARLGAHANRRGHLRGAPRPRPLYCTGALLSTVVYTSMHCTVLMLDVRELNSRPATPAPADPSTSFK